MRSKLVAATIAAFLFSTAFIGGILSPVVFAREETELDTLNRLYHTWKVKKFLKKYDSPMADSSQTFIEVAEKYDLDWRFLVAISGIESGFGKRIPHTSFNPFGFANGQARFSSFDESIETVGEYLSKMKAKGLETPEKLGPIYTPPNFRNWVAAVNFFMQELEKPLK